MKSYISANILADVTSLVHLASWGESPHGIRNVIVEELTPRRRLNECTEEEMQEEAENQGWRLASLMVNGHLSDDPVVMADGKTLFCDEDGFIFAYRDWRDLCENEDIEPSASSTYLLVTKELCEKLIEIDEHVVVIGGAHIWVASSEPQYQAVADKLEALAALYAERETQETVEMAE